MRKLSLLFYLALLSALAAHSATTVLYQGLTSDANGWTNDDWSWMWYDGSYYSGGSYGDGIAYLESPITLAADATVTATFSQKSDTSFADLFADGAGFVVKVNGTNDWVSVAVNYDANGGTDFTPASVDLSPFSGQTIYVGLKASGDTYAEWDVKDLVITSTGNGGGEEPAGDITATFDPADGESVESGSTITVTPEEGATIVSYTIGENTTTVNSLNPVDIVLPLVEGNCVVTVKLSKGLQQNDVQATYFLNAPAPGDITFSIANNATVGPETQVTITSANATQIVYDVENKGTPVTVQGSTAVATLPDADGSYVLTASATRTTGSLSATTTSSLQYTVNVPKPGAITITPNGGTVGTGTNVTIASANAESLAYTFTLEGAQEGEATTITGSSATIKTPETAGTYTLNVTATLGTQTTQATATFTVEALMPGAIVFTPTPTGEQTEVVPGTQVTFTSENADQLTYVLNDNAQKVIDGNSGSLYLPATEGIYTLTVTAHRGSQQIESTVVYKVANPVLGALSFSPASGAELSQGDNVTITAANAERYIYTLTEEGSETTGDEQVYNGSPAIIAFQNVGTWTLNIKAYLDEDFVEGTATYTVSLPLSGPITFNPAPGEIKPGATVTIQSEHADKLEYSIYNGETLVDSKTYNGYAIAQIAMPTDDGEYTVNVTAYRGEKTRQASGVYTVVAPTVPGDISFSPSGGVVPGGSRITIKADPATRVKARLTGSDTWVVANSTKLEYDLPNEPGTYYLEAEAELGTGANITTTSATTEYIIKEETEITGDFVLLYSTSDLADGSQIVLGWYQSNSTSQYIMAAPTTGSTIIPQGNATFTNGVAVNTDAGITLGVEQSPNGYWYIGNSLGYLYIDENGVLSLSTDNKSEFRITLNPMTSAATIKTTSSPAYTICHTTANGGGFTAATSASNSDLPFIYYQFNEIPELPDFSWVETYLPEGGDDITITSKGASSMTYQYKTLDGDIITEGTVVGNKLVVLVEQSGDLNVTATNPYGTHSKSMRYLLSTDPTLDFEGLNPQDDVAAYYWWQRAYDQTDHDKVVQHIWAWTGSDAITNDAFFFRGQRAETDPELVDAYVFNRSALILPEKNVKTIKATFKQIVNQIDELEQQGCRFIIREYLDEYASANQESADQGWIEFNPFNTNGNTVKVMRKADAQDPEVETVTIDLSDYKGKHIQVGFVYRTVLKDGEIVQAPWYVNDVEIRHYVKTSIDDILDDTDADDAAPVEFYNLRGERVNGDNLAPGFYIRRQGTQASKVLIR